MVVVLPPAGGRSFDSLRRGNWQWNLSYFSLVTELVDFRGGLGETSYAGHGNLPRVCGLIEQVQVRAELFNLLCCIVFSRGATAQSFNDSSAEALFIRLCCML